MHIFSKFDWNFRRQIEFNLLKKYIKTAKGGKLLDVACGKGDITNEFSKQFKETYGVDFSAKEIEIAKSQFPHINFSKQDAHKLELPSNYFDAVITNCSLEHFANGSRALLEMQRVLKKKAYSHSQLNVNQK